MRQQLQDVIATVWMGFPCLATVEQDTCTPRLPSLKRLKTVKDWPIPVIGLDGFIDTVPEHYGLSGSPTQVERIFPPKREQEHEIWEGPDSALRLYDYLKRHKFVG